MQVSFVGGMAIANLVKTTLGPKGMVVLYCFPISNVASSDALKMKSPYLESYRCRFLCERHHFKYKIPHAKHFCCTSLSYYCLKYNICRAGGLIFYAFSIFWWVVQDKILQSTGRGHSVTITNDGNPAAKVMVGILV